MGSVRRVLVWNLATFTEYSNFQTYRFFFFENLGKTENNIISVKAEKVLPYIISSVLNTSAANKRKIGCVVFGCTHYIVFKTSENLSICLEMYIDPKITRLIIINVLHNIVLKIPNGPKYAHGSYVINSILGFF